MTMSVIESNSICDSLFPLLNSVDFPAQSATHKLFLARTVIYKYLKFRSLSYPNVFINSQKPMSKRNRSKKVYNSLDNKIKICFHGDKVLLIVYN